MLRAQSRAILAFLAVASAPTILVAQAAVTPLRSATVIELPSPPQGRQAMVFRRASGEDRDVIALAPGAAAVDLVMAMHVLDGLHAALGDTLGRDVVAAVESDPPTDSATVGPRERFAHSLIERLRRSRAREVAGFGLVKALEVKLPKRSFQKAVPTQ